MPEGDAQEKTEQPTPKKRSEAKKKGQVSKSQEVGSLAVLLAGLSTLCLFGSFMYNHMAITLHRGFSMIERPIVDMTAMRQLSERAVLDFIIIVLPVMMAVFVFGVAANVMQVGLMCSWESLMPKLEKMNPLKGLKRFASSQAFMDLFKSLVKLVIVGTVAYFTVKAEFAGLLVLGKLEVPAICLFILKVILKVFFRVCIAMVFLVIIDYAFQKWQFEKQLKMTKQEVKEELKQTEGDPLIKSKIRKVQMEAARRRMMQEVPEADVVVTNPLHLALAIKYDRAVMNAPQLIAKGADFLAEKIKAIAREHDVPIVENKQLARSLYKAVDVGDEIPIDFYQTIAEVLAYVYRIKGKVA